jgi:hypothetical protein
MRLASYLKRSRHGIYYLRWVIQPPAQCPQYPFRTDFSVSLRTTDTRTTASLSRVLAMRLLPAVSAIRIAMLTDLGKAQAMSDELKTNVRVWCRRGRLATVMGRAALADHPRYASDETRSGNEPELRAGIEA